MTNHLYYGDNLQVLRDSIPSESVDLVYLDPPFNSNANYNILFKSPEGTESHAQIEAFEDTWHWTADAEQAFDEVMQSGHGNAAEMLRAMRAFLGENDMMAYLTMMAVRLIELHRVLKETGSLYLHCDPTASHYLKILLDGIFGKRSFSNEIVWHRTGSTGSSKAIAKKFPCNHDVILFYRKSNEFTFYQVREDYSDKYKSRFSKKDERGFYYLDNLKTYSEVRLQQLIIENRVEYTKHGKPRIKNYLHEGKGVVLDDIWLGIDALNSQAQERLGYPTQKPLALLERIVNASSNEGDIVLDPFCGCGSTIHAAQKLNRKWIGIDITHLSVSLIERRLKDAFPGVQFETHGIPKDVAGAFALAEADKYQFQWWAVSLIGAQPYGGKKKGADGGIDGHIYFKPDGKTTEKAIVSVKGGMNVSVPMIRDLAHVVEREKAKIGVFITLADPTKPMLTEAIKAGYYETEQGKFPKIQILTIEELFAGKKPHMPWIDSSAFKKAAMESTAKQIKLL